LVKTLNINNRLAQTVKKATWNALRESASGSSREKSVNNIPINGTNIIADKNEKFSIIIN